MMDAKLLRSQIQEVTTGLIGSYTLPGGQVVPALAVDTNGKYPPSGTKVEGLEIVIVPNISSNPRPGIGNSRIWEYISRIYLKQWDGSGDTLGATEKIIPLLGNKIQVGPRILPNDSIGNIESRTITFSSFINKTPI